MSQYTGVVHLEDLPEKETYLQLNQQLHNFLEREIRIVGIIKFAQINKLNKSILLHWLVEHTALRLDQYKRILQTFDIHIKETYSHIEFLRGKSGTQITNPRLPFDFTTISGVRIIAGILGDGCLSKNYSLFYANSTLQLVHNFIGDMKNVFGEIKPQISQKTTNHNVKIITYPSLCGKIVNFLGILPGRKVVNNPHIPKFIFKLLKIKRWFFVSQIFDDEGSVNTKSRHLKIKFAVEELHKKSHILMDTGKLFLSLGVNFSVYKGENYSSTRGPNRDSWILQINGSIQLKYIFQNIILNHKEKEEKLKRLCDSYVLTQFQKRNAKQIYLSTMKEIQESKGYFTSIDIAQAVNRAVGSCRNTILAYKKQGLLKCIKAHTSGNTHEFARYQVIL